MSEDGKGSWGGGAVKNTNNRKLFANGDPRSPIVQEIDVFSHCCANRKGFVHISRLECFYPPSPSYTWPPSRFFTLLEYKMQTNVELIVCKMVVYLAYNSTGTSSSLQSLSRVRLEKTTAISRDMNFYSNNSLTKTLVCTHFFECDCQV